MAYPRLASVLTACLFLLGGCGQPPPDETPAADGTQEPRSTPVPADAKVSIELDQAQYFLGENVMLHFCVENTGTEPFSITLGGDYRGASRRLSFNVKAFDAAGKLCDDPDPNQFCMGGLVFSPEVKPGAKHYESVALLRYRRIDSPGVYRIQVSHGLGWSETAGRKIPVAEATIRFVRPTDEQAREFVEAALKADGDHMGVSGEKTRAFSDLAVLRDPVYLPTLLEHAQKKSEKALEAIGSIATPRATEVLIQLARDKDPRFALSAAQTLDSRLPDPQMDDKLPGRGLFENDRLDARRQLVKQSWDPRFADDVADLAHQFLTREDRDGLQCGGFMLQCVGREEDLPHLIRALDREIAAVEKRPREENQYPRPRGACRELLRAARMICARGLKESPATETPGQAVVFPCAIGTSSDTFRPDGWEKDFARLMQHGIAYIREVAVGNLPAAAPEPLLQLLPLLITDKDVDVQIAACDLAQKLKRSDLKEPVLKALATTREHWAFNAASNAAYALDARWERLEVLVSRLDEEGMTQECLSDLVNSVIEWRHGRSGPSDKWTMEDAKACKARWVRFLQDHSQELKAGKTFKQDDPTITADLHPTVDFQ